MYLGDSGQRGCDKQHILLIYKRPILACEEAGITVTLPKPMTSNAKAEGRFGKQDFRYVADENVYVCPAGEKLAYSFTTQDKGMVLRRYRTTACHSCAIKNSSTKGKERLILRWEHEQLSRPCNAGLMSIRRRCVRTVEHPFGTIKARMGATHFLMKTLPRVASEMALHVLAYNLTRVMNIIGIQPLITAMRAWYQSGKSTRLANFDDPSGSVLRQSSSLLLLDCLSRLSQSLSGKPKRRLKAWTRRTGH